MKLCLYLLFNLIAYFAFANGKPIQDEENFKNDVGLVNEMEPSSLNDIILDYRKSDQLSLADASEGIEDYQQNQDEENYKNDEWFFTGALAGIEEKEMVKGIGSIINSGPQSYLG